MSSSRPVFRSRWLPYVLVAPQLIITLIFFIWPAGEALWYSLQSVDPFGLSSQFVGLDNFVALFHDPYYLDSFWTTIKFSALVTVSGLLISLFFAALVDYVVRGSRFYQTLMLLPYAVAPAVAAVLWIFLFNPGRGLISHFLGELGYPIPAALLDPILCVVNKIIPCLDGAGYDDCTAKLILMYAAALMATSSGARRIKSQGAPSGASRSFDYGDDGITWLRDSLAKLDTSGCTSELPISAGNSVGLFLVVGGC